MSCSNKIVTGEELIQIKPNVTQQLKKEKRLVKYSSKPNPIKNILLINIPRLTIRQLNDEFQSTLSFGTQSKPTAKTHYEIYPPLGLLYLSSMFKEKNNVDLQIFDMHLNCIQMLQKNTIVNWKKVVDDAIKKYKPDLVGISSMFGASFEGTKFVGETIKKHYKDIIVVCGGVHMTGLANNNDENLKFADFICLNESEYHFLWLVEYLNNEKDTLTGVVVNNKTLLRNEADLIPGSHVVQDLDTLPIPDFGSVDLKNYYKYGILSGAQTIDYDTPLATMQTVRGCIARCSFCAVRSFNGLGVRMHSSKRVLEEIDLLYNKFGIRHVDFVDDDFTYDRQRVMEITDGIIDRDYNFTWSIGNGVRLGSLDEEMLKNMEKSGCTYLSFGIESGDDEILRQMKKPLTLEILREKVKLLDICPKIYYRANFITGYPGETKEQLQKTMDVAEKYPWDWNLFSICKPLPDTDLWNELLENNADFEGVGNNTDQDYNYSSYEGKVFNDAGDEYIFNTSYDFNLKSNFKNNKNLNGRNVVRAVKDFERIVAKVENHAFAWNCLAIGYKKLKQYEKSEHALENTMEIIKKNSFWRKKFIEHEFLIDDTSCTLPISK